MARNPGQFQKGRSGNPAGRPAKPVTELIEQAMKGKREDAIRRMEALAGKGDVTAAKWLADRLYPAPKPCAGVVEIPALVNPSTSLTDKASAILAAVGAGCLAPDIGRDLLGALAGVTKILEIDDIIRRLDALERATTTGN